MSWEQIVEPDSSVQGQPSYCLGMVQRIYGAPGRYYCAWDSWQANPDKHETRDLPDVSVPIFFSMWANLFGEYRNWGHVAAWIPGKGILNVPAQGTGQKWFRTIDECARWNNATYVGWTESLNGLNIVKWDGIPNPPKHRGKQKMATLYYCAEIETWALAGDGLGSAAWLETKGSGLATEWSAWFGGPNVNINKKTWDQWKAFYLAGAGSSSIPSSIDYEKLAKAIFDEQAKRLQS